MNTATYIYEVPFSPPPRIKVEVIGVEGEWAIIKKPGALIPSVVPVNRLCDFSFANHNPSGDNDERKT